MIDILSTALLANGVLYLATWAWGTRIANISIIDGIWSLSFALTLTVCLFEKASVSIHQLLLAGLIYVWALRLSVHLFPRSLSHGEDHRYTRMRQGWRPEQFVWWSLVGIFGLQLILSLLLSIPFIGALTSTSQPTTAFFFGLLLSLFGFVYETCADLQLKAFRSQIESEKRVLDTGLWRYSRHPNYFGEWLFWWGIWIASADLGAPWWSIYAPILLTALLLRVSGVANMESKIEERRPDYRRYIDSTNAFFPGPLKSTPTIEP